jgi:glucosamine--fructose-6-phosphate aminotransferase (isomerizing)
MGIRGKFTHQEIFSQPESWALALETLDKQCNVILDFSHKEKFEQVIFTGCGSTYYLSLAAAPLFQEMTGLPARALPASELWLYPRSAYIPNDRTLLIAISRSGETTETLQACEAFNSRGGGSLMTMVCCPDSRLASMGAVNLIFPSGMEKSVAQTRAFSTLYLGVVGLSTLWSGRIDLFNKLNTLPSVARRLLSNYGSMAQQIGKNLRLDRIFFLGSGARYGLACELNLKMKEMSLTNSEAFHFLEFRHGPKSMVASNTLVIGLISEENSPYEFAVLEEMRILGGQVLSIGETHTDITFMSGIEEVIRNILYLLFGQVMAYERSLAKGLDPDHPNNLDSVVILNR